MNVLIARCSHLQVKGAWRRSTERMSMNSTPGHGWERQRHGPLPLLASSKSKWLAWNEYSVFGPDQGGLRHLFQCATHPAMSRPHSLKGFESLYKECRKPMRTGPKSPWNQVGHQVFRCSGRLLGPYLRCESCPLSVDTRGHSPRLKREQLELEPRNSRE